jgi:hypothetical protein
MRCVTQREDGSRTRSVRLSCLSDATAVVFTRFGPEDRFTLTPMTPTQRLLRLTVAGRSPAPTPGLARLEVLHALCDAARRRRQDAEREAI